MITGPQLQNQTPGQQPSFITGSYPGASWSVFDSDNNGYGVYLPYSTQQEIAGGPANQQYVTANQNVENQFAALLLQAFPVMTEGQSSNTNVAPPTWASFLASVASAPAGSQNNPTGLTSSTVSSIPGQVVVTVPPSSTAGQVVQSGATGSSLVSTPGQTPAMTGNDNTNVTSTQPLQATDWTGLLLIGGLAVVGVIVLGKVL